MYYEFAKVISGTSVYSNLNNILRISEVQGMDLIKKLPFRSITKCSKEMNGKCLNY